MSTSLANLGKAKEILGLFTEKNKIPETSFNAAAVDTLIVKMKSLRETAKMEDLVKSFKQLGLSAEDITQIFADCGDKSHKVREVLDDLGDTGVSVFQKMKLGAKEVGESIKQIPAKIAAFFSSTAGGVTIAIAAIVALAAAYNHFATASDRAMEEHQEAVAKFEETTAEIETLEASLESARQKLEELNSTDSAEFVDPEEITKLEASIALMEKQLEIKQRLSDYEAQEAAKSAVDVLTAKNLYVTDDTPVTTDSGVIIPKLGWRTIIDEAEYYKDEIEDITKQVADGYSKLDGLRGQEGTAAYEEQKKIVERLEARKEKLDTALAETEQQIIELYSSLIRPDGSAVSGYEEWVRLIELLLELDDPGTKVKNRFHENLVNSGVSNTILQFMDSEFVKWYDGLTDDQKDIVFKLSCDATSATWNLHQWQAKLAETEATTESITEETKTMAESLQSKMQTLWDSEGFADSRKELVKLSKSLDGIDEKDIEALATEGSVLAEVLEEDGMNAKFLASILQKVAEGEDGLSLITDEMLELNKALEGAAGMFDKVTEARQRYNDALSVPEKDDSFKTFADAYAKIQEEIKAGTTNSNTFWASAELLFGESQLAEWGWGDGIENIKSAVTDMPKIFGDAESAGTGLLNVMYSMAQAGELVGENGEKLVEISKNASGGYDFAIDPSNISKIAKKMNLSEEAILACIEAMSMFGEVTYYNLEEVVSALDNFGITIDIAGEKAINLQQLEAHLRALGWGSKAIHDLVEQMKGLDGVTLIDVNAEAGALVSNLQTLGLVTQDGNLFKIDYVSLVEFLAQIGFTREQVELLTSTLENFNGLEIANIEHKKTILDKTLWKGTEDGLYGILDAADDVNDSSIDNVSDQFEEFRKKCVLINKELQKMASNIGAVNSSGGPSVQTGGSGGSTGAHQGNISTTPIQREATGTSNSPGGLALLGDEYSPTGEPKPELVVSGGEAYLAGVDGPVIGNLKPGDRVYTASETKKILRSNRKAVGRIPAFEGGGTFAGSNIPGSTATGTGSTSSGAGLSSDAESEFERLYKYHQHLRAMEQETDAEYLAWLVSAYKEAYEKGEMELDDYRKYTEEVYELQKEIFQDHLSDIEHQIEGLNREAGNQAAIIALYEKMIADIKSEIASAKSRGLDENSEYIQELESQLWDYQDEISDIQEEISENAKDALDELIDYRIDMLKEELEAEKDTLDSRLDELQDFYDKQKQMLQDKYDEEKYLEEQSEKRKSKSNIEAELARLRFDDSAWAQKRKLELESELAAAQKDLDSFEKDHALEDALALLDKQQEEQTATIEAQIDALDKKLNDPKALYNRALSDIQDNTANLYEEMVEYNFKNGSGNAEDVAAMWDEAYTSLKEYMDLFGKAYMDVALVASSSQITSDGYASGTFYAIPGLKRVNEVGPEDIFVRANGDRYRMFRGGEKVLNAKATEFLYNFATSGGAYIPELFADVVGKMRNALLENFQTNNQVVEIKTGDIIIQGNADERTVSQIRREQRAGIDYILKEFTRLNR